MTTQLIFPNQESIYNLEQGKVFFIPINPTTKLATDKGLFVGNVPEEGFLLAPAVQSIKHLESQSGKNRTDKVLETQQSLQVTIRLENVDTENLAQAIFGTSVRLLETTVTNEIHTVYKGRSFFLERPNVSSFTITNPTGLILNRDYQINAKPGEVFIPNSSSLVDESLVNIYYSAPPINRITGYSALNTEVWVRYNGLNMADDLKPIVAEVFKVRFSPTSVLDFIKNGFPGMVLELTGEALYEPLLESRVGYEGGIYRVLLPIVNIEPEPEPEPEPDPFIPNGNLTYCQLSSSVINNMRPIDTVNGSFIYCQLSSSVINNMRPIDTVNGSFIYCLFDLANSGFDRNPD